MAHPPGPPSPASRISDVAASDSASSSADRRLPVIAVRQHSPTVFELVLARQGLVFTPGDCVSLYNRAGVSRPYSIASGATETTLRFLIRQMPSGEVTPELAVLRPGDLVRLSPPFGWFRPGRAVGRAPYVFIATGTGIAPFLAHLRSAPAVAPAMILYGVRELADAVWLDELQAAAPVEVAVSRERAAGTHHGRVTDLLDRLPLTPETQVFLCGLDSMIDSVTTWLEARHVTFTRIHREVFFHAAP